MAIALSYDIGIEKIYNNEYLQTHIRRVLNYPDAIVCDVDIGDWHKYEPRIIGWDTPIEDMSPKL